MDVALARKVFCQIDESERQECIGTGESVSFTLCRNRIKVTLNGNSVYGLMYWWADGGSRRDPRNRFHGAGDIILYLADGTLSLLDELRIQLIERRAIHGSQALDVNLVQSRVYPLVSMWSSLLKCRPENDGRCGSQ